MTQLLNDDIQNCLMNSVAHAADMAKASIQEAALLHSTPSAIYKPSLSIDGNQWCALYGDNLQDGVAGFGESPADAMRAFDLNWYKKVSKT